MVGNKHLLRILTIAVMAATMVFVIPVSSRAQCGDVDCNGMVEIADFSAFVDYLVVGESSLSCPDNVEFDDYDLVTMRDFLIFSDGLGSGGWTCGPAHQPAFVPTANPDIYLVINTDKYPAMATSVLITVDIVTTQPIRLLDLPLAIRVNGLIPSNILNLSGTGCSWLAPEGVVRCFRNGSPAIPAGKTRLFSLFAQANPGVDELPITYSYITQPPIQGGQRVRSAMAILPGAQYETYEPLITISPSCCVGLVGNVDCSPDDGVDIADLTVLIDNLFISFTPLCCVAEANCSGDPGNNVDIVDLTALIDNLFNFGELASCQ